jgi:hypothetical protein
MKNKFLLLLLACLALANPICAFASVLPVGVQHNLSESALTADGFTKIFSTSWSQPTHESLTSIFSGLNSTNNLFFGVELAGSPGIVYIGAGANFADATHDTGPVGIYGGSYTSVFKANGASWYFTPGTASQVGSWGFTDIGTIPQKNQCDTNVNVNTLCMHTMNNQLLSGYDIGGTFQSDATLVLFSSPAITVPEPASMALVLAGLVGFGVLRKKSAKA